MPRIKSSAFAPNSPNKSGTQRRINVFVMRLMQNETFTSLRSLLSRRTENACRRCAAALESSGRRNNELNTLQLSRYMSSDKVRRVETSRFPWRNEEFVFPIRTLDWINLLLHSIGIFVHRIIDPRRLQTVPKIQSVKYAPISRRFLSLSLFSRCTHVVPEIEFVSNGKSKSCGRRSVLR